MKKKIVVMLSLMLCLLLSISLAACKGNDPEAPDNPGEPSAPAGETNTADQHEAKSAWSSDETEHWHDCATAGHTDKLEKAAHTFGEWSEKTPAGYGTDRVVERSCTVCGKQEEKTDENSALAPKDNTVKVGEIDFTYNAKSQPIDSLVTADNQEEMTVQYEGIGETTYAQSATAPKDAGTYRYTITIPATAEWNAAEFSGEYTIVKYELTLLYEKQTAEYNGTDKIWFRFYTLEDNTRVNIAVVMDSANVGAKVSKIVLPGLLENNNYTVDINKVQIKIVPKKLSNLKITILESDIDKEQDVVKFTTEIDGVNEEKVNVVLEFYWDDLEGEEELQLTLLDLPEKLGTGKCKITLKNAANYELNGTIGTLVLEKETAK